MKWNCYKLLKKITIISYYIILSSCGEGQSSTKSQRQQTELTPVSNKLDLDLIKNIIYSHKENKKVTIPLPLQRITNHSKNQRILIMDGPGIPKSAYSYMNRLIGSYYQNSMGIYEDYSPQARIPASLKEINRYLSHGYHFSIEDLREDLDLAKRIHKLVGEVEIQHSKKFLSSNNKSVNTFVHHGEHIYQWLAYFNPEAQFILAAHPQNRERSDSKFCTALETGDLNPILIFYQNAFLSLGRVIRKHDISHINISWAITRSSTINAWKTCNSSKRYIPTRAISEYLDIIRNFYIKLASNYPVQIFLSLPNDPNEQEPLDEVYHDLPSNIFRIAYMSQIKTQYDYYGTYYDDNNAWEEFPHGQRLCLGYADMAINGRLDEEKLEEYLMDIDPVPTDELSVEKKWWNNSSLSLFRHGIIKTPLKGMASSWATPIALSLMNLISHNVRRANPNVSFHELIRTLRATTEIRIFDPLVHKQFLAYR